MNHSREEREGTVVCLLCRGMISFKAGDKARFESHLQHEHEAYFGLDVLLAVSFMREDERRAVVRCMARGYVDRTNRIDFKLALDNVSDVDITAQHSDASSDFSVDDNDKIYGIPEPVLNCSKCSRTFINIISLRRHEKLHIEQNYSCYECGERFSFLEDLKLHKVGHQTDSIQDEDAMYVTKDNDDTTNTVDDSYVRCKLCLKVMKKESYMTHKMMHKNERKIVCNICNSKFRKHEHLKKHMLKAHKNSDSSTSLNSFMNETVSLCTICNKTFQNESNLAAHMQVHFPQGFKQHIPGIQTLRRRQMQGEGFNLNENEYLPMK